MATHASLLAQPGSAEDTLTSATCGRKCSDLCENSSLLGSLEKTLKATLPLDSMKSLMTWRERATPRGRLYYQLVPSVRRIRENGYSLWQTFAPGTHGRGWSPLRRMCMEMRDGNKPTCQVLTVDQVFVQEMIDTGMSFDEIKKAGGKLNPEWVEWFMGFPRGHTDLDNLETR